MTDDMTDDMTTAEPGDGGAGDAGADGGADQGADRGADGGAGDAGADGGADHGADGGAADSGAAYFGGHERWADNPHGCNKPGPGAVNAVGMVGLSPANGSVVWDPGRARGFGADDMLITSAGLWIASDNAYGAKNCAGVPHPGICFMPYG